MRLFGILNLDHDIFIFATNQIEHDDQLFYVLNHQQQYITHPDKCEYMLTIRILQLYLSTAHISLIPGKLMPSRMQQTPKTCICLKWYRVPFKVNRDSPLPLPQGLGWWNILNPSGTLQKGKLPLYSALGNICQVFNEVMNKKSYIINQPAIKQQQLNARASVGLLKLKSHHKLQKCTELFQAVLNTEKKNLALQFKQPGRRA